MNIHVDPKDNPADRDAEACPYRHEYHLMPPRGWMNDPNGFIQMDGRYHLFYQHNPLAPEWGLMHWGHSVSDDLVRWRHLPVALAPDAPYDRNGCFSGSSVCKDGRLYLFYTGNAMDGRQTQCLAVSDDCVHFVKHERNPILPAPPPDSKPNHFRDPCVVKRGDLYWMAVGSSHRERESGQVILYRSENLLDWTYVNTLDADGDGMGYMWECPGLFTLDGQDALMLSPEGELDNPRFHGRHSSGCYLGALDDKTGAYTHGPFEPLDGGFDFYAPQTAPDATGRRIMVAWMNVWDTPLQMPRCPWAGSITLPRVLSVENGRLKSRPIPEIERYRKPAYAARDVAASAVGPLCGTVCELALRAQALSANPFSVRLFGRADGRESAALVWEPAERLLSLTREQQDGNATDRRTVRLDGGADTLEVRIFLDRSSVEVFINDGDAVMSARVYPERGADGIAFEGDARLVEIALWNLG